jgi:hypothetical protein
MHSDSFQELSLGSPRFIAVFLGVEFERRLDSRKTQDSLHRLRFNLRLVHQPIAERVTEVVKSEPLAVLNLHSRHFRCRPEMISDERRRGVSGRKLLMVLAEKMAGKRNGRKSIIA